MMLLPDSCVFQILGCIRCLIVLIAACNIIAVDRASGSAVPSGDEALAVSWDGFSYSLNADTGITTVLSRPDKLFNAMARNNSGEFIASDNFNVIYAINPANGSAAFLTAIGGLGDSESIRGMAFTADDRLLAVVSTPFNPSIDSLYEIDLSAGQGAFIGSTGLEGLQSLAVSGNGILYSFDLEESGLVTINPATGAVADVSAINGAQGATIQSLAFARDGALYGFGQSAIYSINRRNGALTEIADLSVDIRGAEFAVPEPNFGLIYAAFGALACWRRWPGRLWC